MEQRLRFALDPIKYLLAIFAMIAVAFVILILLYFVYAGVPFTQLSIVVYLLGALGIGIALAGIGLMLFRFINLRRQYCEISPRGVIYALEPKHKIELAWSEIERIALFEGHFKFHYVAIYLVDEEEYLKRHLKLRGSYLPMASHRKNTYGTSVVFSASVWKIHDNKPFFNYLDEYHCQFS
jgi:hypothetical protein